MFFLEKRKLAESARRLNRSTDRDVPIAAVEALVRSHVRPTRLAQILRRVLDFETDRSAYDAAHPQKEQQKFNHRCDYAGACRIDDALSLFFDSYDLADAPGYDADFVARCSAELGAQGYSLLQNFVPSAECERIVEFLGQDHLQFREDLSGKTHRGYSARNVDATTSNVCRLVDQSALLACPQVSGLLLNPSLVAIAQAFLGAPPIHTQVACWWSTPYSEELEHIKTAAQLFHQDRDYIKFLKIFIHLTDVDETSGPHEFVAGSNADYTVVSKNKQRSSKRLTDAYLRSIYPEARFRKFTAPRGSIILEDTSGFHKGNPVVRGHRLMLQLEFVSTLFGNPGYPLRRAALEHVAAPFSRLDRFFSAYGP